jgi:hypothetical protein
VETVETVKKKGVVVFLFPWLKPWATNFESIYSIRSKEKIKTERT